MAEFDGCQFLFYCLHYINYLPILEKIIKESNILFVYFGTNICQKSFLCFERNLFETIRNKIFTQSIPYIYLILQQSLNI